MMKRIYLASVLLAIAVTTNAQNLKDYRWEMVEASGDAVGRHENAFIEFQDKFYLIGGRGIKPVNVFNPATSTWETKGETPMEFHHFQAIVHENAIYLVGAMTGPYPKELPTENIWIYYPDKDKWMKGPEVPVEIRRGGAGAVIHDNKIYMACGIAYGHTSGTTNRFDSYDLETKEWTSLTEAPHVRDHFSGIVVNDKLYCIGGRNTSVHYKDQFNAFFSATIPYVDEYDFKLGKWFSHKNTLPVPTAAGGVVAIGNKIVYMGGEGMSKKAYAETQCLDLETGEWKLLTPLNIGRHGSNAIFYNNKIYFAAGSPKQGGGNMNTIEIFTMKP